MTGFKGIGPGQVGHVYVLRLKSDPNLFKIGRSALGKLDARFTRLRVGELLEVEFAGIFFPYREWERVAHLENRDVRLPQSEYFRLSRTRLDDLLFALSLGNLEKEVVSDSGSLLVTCDEMGLVVHQGVYDPLIIGYQSVDAFGDALAAIKSKVELGAEQAFLRANFSPR
jgi:hypothetical protein